MCVRGDGLRDIMIDWTMESALISFRKIKKQDNSAPEY